jgi:hypothetical protein
MRRDPLTRWLIGLVAASALSLPGCGKQSDPAPPSQGPSDRRAAQAKLLARYTGEWHDQWHYLTVEADGSGYHHTDFGTACQDGEIEIRQLADGASPGAVLHLFGGWGWRGAEGEAVYKKHINLLYTLRLRDESSLELRADGGKVLYVLKKMAPRPATKLRDLAGNWTVVEATVAVPNADFLQRLPDLALSLDEAGRAKWQAKGGRMGTLTVQECDGRFTVGDFVGLQWQSDPIFIGKDRLRLRLRTTDRSVRLFLRRVKK